MRAIGNLLWFMLGGVFMGLGWWLAGLLTFITIVGIPWGRACFVIGSFCFSLLEKKPLAEKNCIRKVTLVRAGWEL